MKLIVAFHNFADMPKYVKSSWSATHNGLLFDCIGVDEPLPAGTQNDRLLSAPIVRVTVYQLLWVQNVCRKESHHSLAAFGQHWQSVKGTTCTFCITAIFIHKAFLQMPALLTVLCQALSQQVIGEAKKIHENA